MPGLFKRFRRDETGATAIEYGMVAAMIAVAIIASLIALGGGIDSLYGTGLEGPAAIMSEAANGI